MPPGIQEHKLRLYFPEERRSQWDLQHRSSCSGPRHQVRLFIKIRGSPNIHLFDPVSLCLFICVRSWIWLRIPEAQQLQCGVSRFDAGKGFFLGTAKFPSAISLYLEGPQRGQPADWPILTTFPTTTFDLASPFPSVLLLLRKSRRGDVGRAISRRRKG